MSILLSRIPPIRHRRNNFISRFAELIGESEYLNMSTGYVSVQSLLFCLENVKAGTFPPTDLLIGMHGVEGFTRPQYDLAIELASELKRTGGDVFICTSFAFHGKLYTFHKGRIPFAGILGSSNLSALDSARGRTFEVDWTFEDPVALGEAVDLQTQLLSSSVSRRISEWTPGPFRNGESRAVDIPGVEMLNTQERAIYIAARTGISFEIPLKTTRKSNLNVFFGEGRLNSINGLVRPRPWYEVEIIVSRSITSRPSYPRNEAFVAVTDDGWKFELNTNGDNAKNLRSTGSLVTLGAWIKGRLEAIGVLRVGEMITEETLQNYGRDTITLTKTSIGDIWYLDFSV